MALTAPKPRVRQTSTTTGTGTYSFDATIPDAHLGFVAEIGNTNTCHVLVTDSASNDWEWGIYTVTDASPDTLARTTVKRSTNSNAAVSWSAGTRTLSVIWPPDVTEMLALLGVEAGAKDDQTASEIKTLLENGIDSVHYVDGSIDTAHLGDLQVTTAKIAADAITSAKIGDDVINSEHYVAASIDNEHLADDAVDSAEIADGAIDLVHMSSESVDEDNLHVSNSPTNGYMLTAQSGNAGGLTWAAAGGGGGATDINGLSDALIESNSLYLGNDPSGTTSTAEYNVAVGTTALDAITTGDNNTALGYDALTANTTGSWLEQLSDWVLCAL